MLAAAKVRKQLRRVKNAYKALKQGVLPILSSREIAAMAKETGFSEREAKAIEPFSFVLSCVLASTVEAKRGFASVWRVFNAATGLNVVRSAVTQRFGKGSAELLKRVFERAMERVPQSAHPEMLAKLEQFSRVLAHDGSVLALSSLLSKMFPSTRTNSVAAAAKLHATADVVNRRIVKAEITSERGSELDVVWRQEVVEDALYLSDLGYYCHAYFGNVIAEGGHVISRLKGNANPTLVEAFHGVRAPKQSEGMAFKSLHFVKSSRTFDVLAAFSTNVGPIELRVVGVRDAETGEFHCYVTDLPPDEFTAEEIALLYRFRWVIELLFLQLKSFCHLDHIDTSNPEALRTHIYASLTASIVLHALLVVSAQAAGVHPSEISHLTVAAAAPLLAIPLLLLWTKMKLTRERLAELVLAIIVVGCRQQNPRRYRRQWGGLGGSQLG